MKAEERAKDRGMAEAIVEELSHYARKQDVHMGLPVNDEGALLAMCEIVYKHTDPIGEQAEKNTEDGIMHWLKIHGYPKAAMEYTAWKGDR